MFAVVMARRGHHLALPNQYGTKLFIQDAAAFRDAYGDQADEESSDFVLIEPTTATLKEWAKSTLCVGPYRGLHPCGGWSPFRSGEVSVRRAATSPRDLYYKLGDNNTHDFTSATHARDYGCTSWSQVLRRFIYISLETYMNEGERCAISPRQKIAKMLYYEYGRTAFLCDCLEHTSSSTQT